MLAHVYDETHRNSKSCGAILSLPRCKTFNLQYRDKWAPLLYTYIYRFAAHENAKCKIGQMVIATATSHRRNNKACLGQMQFAAATRTKNDDYGGRRREQQEQQDLCCITARQQQKRLCPALFMQPGCAVLGY